jgi:hypothetical protein
MSSAIEKAVEASELLPEEMQESAAENLFVSSQEISSTQGCDR